MTSTPSNGDFLPRDELHGNVTRKRVIRDKGGGDVIVEPVRQQHERSSLSAPHPTDADSKSHSTPTRAAILRRSTVHRRTTREPSSPSTMSSTRHRFFQRGSHAKKVRTANASRGSQ
jgi:hypothetical protein